MKKLLVIILLFVPTLIFAQNKEPKKINLGFEIGNKYFHTFTIGNREYTSIVNMQSNTPIEMTLYLNYKINKLNTVSLGVSAYNAFISSDRLTPTIIDYKYFFKESRNTAFINAGIGYTLFNPTDIRSTVFKVGGGYRFSITKKKNMHISVNYDLNKLFVPNVYFYDIKSFKDVNVDVYSFNVKIGIGF